MEQANLQFFCRKGREIGSEFLHCTMVLLNPLFGAEIPDERINIIFEGINL
jgi:hypothetical protein